METRTIYAVNPERRDPGFRKNKVDIGLGKVDNISSSDLMKVIVENAAKIFNDKKSGLDIVSSGECFFPLFESAGQSSTCSLEVGFLRENKEVASFEFSFSYYYSDEGAKLSYSLSVAPEVYLISNYYLKLFVIPGNNDDENKNRLMGGIYCDNSFNLDNFDHVSVNMVHWTPGSKLLEPSQHEISYYTQYTNVANIPLNSSSNTLNSSADSVVIYDTFGNPQLPKSSYLSKEFETLYDAPTINDVPFLIKEVLIDNKEGGRHLTVPAKHKSSKLEDAGEHDWEVLGKIRKAGLHQTSTGAEPINGKMVNDDNFGYGITRLSRYGELDRSNVSIQNLNEWIKTLGIDTDVISAGLFRNFVGYLTNIIDSNSNQSIYNFSLEDSDKDFLYVDHIGSDGDGISLVFNSYKREYNNGVYSDSRVTGNSGNLIKVVKNDTAGIIGEITLSLKNDYQIEALVPISRNNSEDYKSAEIIFTQLDGNDEGMTAPITVHINQSGFKIEYGILIDNESQIYEHDTLLIAGNNESFTKTQSITPIITENSSIGYHDISSEVTMSFILDDSARSWVSWDFNELGELTIECNNNTISTNRSAAGFIIIKSDEDIILGQIPVLITQSPVKGVIEILSNSYITVNKHGGDSEVSINSNYPWTVMINSIPSWISLPGFSGSRKSGRSILTLRIDKNESGDPNGRTANLILRNDFGTEATITVQQSGKDTYFDIDGYPDTDIYLSMGENYGRDVVTVSFHTDKNWLIDYKPDWIDVDRSSGTPTRKSNGQIQTGWKVTLTYNPNKRNNEDYGDYVSFGYFNEENKSIYSLRKIYISLSEWRNNMDISYDSWNVDEFGAYLYGPVYKTLKPGQTYDIYSVASGRMSGYYNDYIRDHVSSESPVDESKGIPVINLPIEYKFTTNWIMMSQEEIETQSIYYPNLWSFKSFFPYKRTIEAIDKFDESTEIRNIETSNVFDALEYVSSVEGGCSLNGTDVVVKSYLHKILPSGLIIIPENGGTPSGITISGIEQDITLTIAAKEVGQPFFNPFLMNEKIEGWLYFNEDLTELTNINPYKINGSKNYTIHVLPNRTGKDRSVTLNLTDRGIKNTQISYTITQKSISYESSRVLVGAVPILENKIVDHNSAEIKLRALLTYKETYRIEGEESKTRTYRELPETFVATFIKSVDDTWYSINKRGSSWYINITPNPESSPRSGLITIMVPDGENEISGTLRIFQPSSTVPVRRTLGDNFEATAIDLGKSDNKVPMEIYSIGYKLKSSLYIDYGETRIYEYSPEEIFPESLEDLSVSSTAVQNFDMSTPLNLTRKDPVGLEEQSSLDVTLYGSQASLIIHQDLTDIPFELDYSYYQIGDNPVDIYLELKRGDVQITGNTKLGETSQGSYTYISIPQKPYNSVTDSLTQIGSSGTLKVIPGLDRGYDKYYGLSIQKRLALKPNSDSNSIIFTSSNGKEFKLTLVPSPNENIIRFDKENSLENKITNDGYRDLYHYSTLPHMFCVSGTHLQYPGTQIMGEAFAEYPGEDLNWQTEFDFMYKKATENFLGNSSYYCSPFCSPYYPIYVKIKDVERTGESDQVYFRISAKPYSGGYHYSFDPGKEIKFDSNFIVDKDVFYFEDKVLMKRDADHYVIDYSGIPCGVKLKSFEFKNEIPGSYESIPENMQSAPANSDYVEISVINLYRNDGTDLHGMYEEIPSVGGNQIYITPKWGQNRQGVNPGQEKINSGLEFLVATATFEFTIFSDEGTTTKTTKNVDLYYQGKEGGATLSVPSNNQIIMRHSVNPKTNTRGIAFTSSSVTWPTKNRSQFPIYFDITTNFWIIRETNSIDYYNNGMTYDRNDWLFNGTPYSHSYDAYSDNSGYTQYPTYKSVNLSIDNSKTMYMDLLEEHTSIEPSDYEYVNTFSILGSPSIDGVNWDQRTGPSIKVVIGPPTPYLEIINKFYPNDPKASRDNQNLTFMLFPIPLGNTEKASYILQAKFKINCPYNLTTEQIGELFKIRSFSGTGNMFSSLNSLVDPVSEWTMSLIYSTLDDSFYLTLESRDPATGLSEIYLTRDNTKTKFGSIVFGLQDPIFEDEYYELTLNTILPETPEISIPSGGSSGGGPSTDMIDLAVIDDGNHVVIGRKYWADAGDSPIETQQPYSDTSISTGAFAGMFSGLFDTNID